MFVSVLCATSQSTLLSRGSFGEWREALEVCIRKANLVASLPVLGKVMLCVCLVGSEYH